MSVFPSPLCLYSRVTQVTSHSRRLLWQQVASVRRSQEFQQRGVQMVILRLGTVTDKMIQARLEHGTCSMQELKANYVEVPFGPGCTVFPLCFRCQGGYYSCMSQ